MLSLGERQQVLKFYRLVSTVVLFPVSVDPKTWEIRSGCRSKWAFLACAVSFSLFGAHAVYKCLSLLHAFDLYPTIPLYKMVLHAQLAISAVIFAFWYYILHVRDGCLNSQLARLILTVGITEGTIKNLYILIFYWTLAKIV